MSMSSRIRSALPANLHAAAVFVILLACYAYFPPRWADWNQNSRFDLVVALVENGTLQIDRYVENTGDYAVWEGHFYSDKAPGVSMLGVPVYAAFRRVVAEPLLASATASATVNPALGATLRRDGSGLASDKVRFFAGLVATTFVTVALPSAALGVVFFWAAGALGMGVRARFWATLLYGLATSAFPYANAFVGHQTAAALLFGAFALLFAVRTGRAGRQWLPAAGLMLGYAVVTEYPAALIAGVLGLYALWVCPPRLETFQRLVAGALPALAILVVHDVAAFGTPLPIGYFHSALWTDVHQTGFLSITYPRPDALWGLTFDSYRGLFYLSPYLLLAVPGCVALWRRPGLRPEFWVLVLAPAALMLFTSASAMWTGGFAVGPRYVVAGLPFLALAAGLGVALAWSRVRWRPAVLLLACWSFGAVWAETIAGQAFPDFTPNPLFNLSLPLLARGEVARNAGMALGLAGWTSVLPLAVVVSGVLVLLVIPPSRLRADSVQGPIDWTVRVARGNPSASRPALEGTTQASDTCTETGRTSAHVLSPLADPGGPERRPASRRRSTLIR